MDEIRTLIYTVARNVLMGTNAGLTAAQVYAEDQKAPRPSPPCISVRVPLADVVVGHDEVINQVVGTPPADESKLRQRGQRRGTLSMNAWGSAAAEWITRMKSQLRLPATIALMETGKVWLEPLGGLQDLSSLLHGPSSTRIMPRYLQEFEVFYAVLTAQQAATALELVQVQFDFASTPSDLTGTWDFNV